MKTILYFLGCRCVQYGSFERSILEIARKAKHDGIKFVIVYDNMPENKQFLADMQSAETEILVVNKKSIFSEIADIYRIIKKYAPDIIHAHFQYQCYMVGIINFMFFHKPFFVTRHFIMPEGIKKKSLYLYNLLARISKKVITVSKAAEKDLNIKAGIPSEKIETVYLGVDFSKYRYLSAKQKKELKNNVAKDLNISEDCTLVLTTSHFRPGKGIEDVIDAAKEFEAQNVIFLFAGDGDLRLQLEQRAADNNINNVRFLGIVQNIPDLLGASDIFLFPTSFWPEGLPMSLIEALASGCFIISTLAVEDLQYILKDNENSLVFEPGNVDSLKTKIREYFLLNDEKREAVRKNAKASTKIFAVSDNADKLLSLYKQAGGL